MVILAIDKNYLKMHEDKAIFQVYSTGFPFLTNFITTMKKLWDFWKKIPHITEIIFEYLLEVSLMKLFKYMRWLVTLSTRLLSICFLIP